MFLFICIGCVSMCGTMILAHVRPVEGIAMLPNTVLKREMGDRLEQ